MHSPAQAILWQIFWRYRWGFIAAAAYLGLAILLSHLLPTTYRFPLHDGEVPAVGWFFGVTCFFMNVVLAAPFSMHSGDTRELYFARHLYVLPVRTTTLVTWPMLSGCVLVAIVWQIIVWLVFRPAGIVAPLWLPAAALALLVAVFQALSWTPFAQRWLHAALTVAVLISPILVLLVALINNIEVSEPWLAVMLVGLIPLVYAAAVSGVARARRGDPYDWLAWGRFIEWLARWRPAATHPFRSIHRAQLWYECRAHLLVLVFIVCIFPCFLFVPAIERGNLALGWRLLAILLATPLLVAMLVGNALGSLVDPFSKRDTGTFVLVRPISSLVILRGKLVLAAIMTIAIWALFLCFSTLLLTRPGFPESMARAASSVPTWKAVAYPLLVLLLLVLFTWKNTVETLWIGLAGRHWVETASSFCFGGLVLITFGLSLWIGFNPAWHAAALAAVPWLLGLFLILKLIAAAFVIRGLLHFRLTTLRGAAAMVATWLAAFAPLCALALTMLPPTQATPSTVIPSIALFIPFTRIAGSPLALHWNRHR